MILPQAWRYGCGLRVCEPLNLRIKDVNLGAAQLIIRAGKGGKDRMVSIPCSALEDMREQIESARVVWKRDQQDGVPVALPHQLAVKQCRFISAPHFLKRRRLPGSQP